MRHPFQCLHHSHSQARNIPDILLAALGPYLHSFDVESGLLLATWSANAEQDPVESRKSTFANEIDAKNGSQDDSNLPPPAKRQRTSSVVAESDSSSAEIVVEDDEASRESFANAIIKLKTTRDGNYVVIVTNEDKCLRVIELSTDGALRQLSERIMPKRPCAIAITPDNLNILCADKFGDVYSLPLLGKTYEIEADRAQTGSLEKGKSLQDRPKPFVPSATFLTVHTKKNRNALKQQQNLLQKRKPKPTLTFDHLLLLGHVSLLTDLAYVTYFGNGGKPRNYLLTSDRDEHIRVSRGIPQTHIIEGYCLGHTHFISKIAILGSQRQFLVSGGGDDFLLLWDWLGCSIKQKISLRPCIQEFQHLLTTQYASQEGSEVIQSDVLDRDFEHIAVSNIQILETTVHTFEIIIAIEGMPGLFFFSLESEGSTMYRGLFRTTGNVVDIAILPKSNAILYSMDTIHLPLSKSVVGDTESMQINSVSILSYQPISSTWQPDTRLVPDLLSKMEGCARSRPFVTQTSTAKGKSLRELLYSLESLRKRVNGADEEAEEAD